MITNLVLVSHNLPLPTIQGSFMPHVTTVWVHVQYSWVYLVHRCACMGSIIVVDAHEGLKT